MFDFAAIILVMSSPSPKESLGYPIFLSVDGGRCSYGIQDMIGLRQKDVRRWMKNLSHKDRQVDLVLNDEKSERCARAISRVVRKTGFEKIRNISYKKWSVVAKEIGYSGLPPE